jgi:hypothetical protein
VAATTNNVVSYESDRIAVVQSGPQIGRLVVDPAGDAIRVGIAADPQRFEARFLATLDAAARLVVASAARDRGLEIRGSTSACLP